MLLAHVLKTRLLVNYTPPQKKIKDNTPTISLAISLGFDKWGEKRQIKRYCESLF